MWTFTAYNYPQLLHTRNIFFGYSVRKLGLHNWVCPIIQLSSGHFVSPPMVFSIGFFMICSFWGPIQGCFGLPSGGRDSQYISIFPFLSSTSMKDLRKPSWIHIIPTYPDRAINSNEYSWNSTYLVFLNIYSAVKLSPTYPYNVPPPVIMCPPQLQVGLDSPQ